MGAATFGYVDFSVEDDTKHNANTMIPMGIKQVEEEPEEIPVETPEEIPVENTDAPAADVPVTSDAGIVAAATVMAVAAGVVLSKKH